MMTYGFKVWIVALAVTGLAWALLFFIIALLASAAQPPACRDDVCPMYGPGGRVADWTLHVQLGDLAGKRFIVPATCASACAIAVGVGLYIGADIRISPTATFVPHNRAAILAETRMPPKFRALMLAYRPFHYRA